MLIPKEFKYKNLEVMVLSEVDSTNTLAMRIDVTKDTLIIADYQTGGRGRHDRYFYSPKSKGLYFSLVLLDLNLSAQLYTILIAIAVSQNIKNSHIKWLNDIMIDDKKVSGILCEGVLSQNKYSKMVIGVGINLYPSEIDESLKDTMTWLNDLNLEPEDLLTNILNSFYELLDLEVSDIINRYKQKCSTLGRWIKINQKDYYAFDINENGHLICHDAQQKVVVFNNAEVSIQK